MSSPDDAVVGLVTLPAAADAPGRPCLIASALSVVGEKWALLVVRELFYGNHRFDQLVRNTGAPRDRLAARLRALEAAGVVRREAYSQRPPRFEYHLTTAGRDLFPVIQALVTWSHRWAGEEPPISLEHHGDHELDPVWTCRTCGDPVRTEDLQLHVHSPGWDRRGPRPGPERDADHAGRGR